MRKLFLAAPLLLLCSACSGDMANENTIVIQGSDTEVQLVSTMVEAFAKIDATADISVAGGGSAVGIAALMNGETDIANSSRKMKPEEIVLAKEKGRDPQEFILARDGLSIVVHPENPLAKISMGELGKVFAGTMTNWKELGGPDAPIVLYGRQSTSGTFSFFRDTVVKGDYASSMRQMEGTQAIIDAVMADKFAIGYAGVGYVKDENGEVKTTIKVIPVSKDIGGTAYSPLDVNAVEKQLYPIARQIFQYLPATPAKGSALEAFLKFEASDEGQAIVEKVGFYRAIQADKKQNDAFFAKIR
jgi:phosphate transport system substrate-binding protein